MNSLLSDYGDYRPVHGSHLSGTRFLQEMQVDVFLFRHGMRRMVGFLGPPKGVLVEHNSRLSIKSQNTLLIPPGIFSFDQIYLADGRNRKDRQDRER